MVGQASTWRVAPSNSSVRVICSNTVLPIIILISSDRSCTCETGFGVDVFAVAHDCYVVAELEVLFVEPVRDVTHDGNVSASS